MSISVPTFRRIEPTEKERAFLIESIKARMTILPDSPTAKFENRDVEHLMQGILDMMSLYILEDPKAYLSFKFPYCGQMLTLDFVGEQANLPRNPTTKDILN